MTWRSVRRCGGQPFSVPTNPHVLHFHRRLPRDVPHLIRSSDPHRLHPPSPLSASVALSSVGLGGNPTNPPGGRAFARSAASPSHMESNDFNLPQGDKRK